MQNLLPVVANFCCRCASTGICLLAIGTFAKHSWLNLLLVLVRLYLRFVCELVAEELCSFECGWYNH